MPTRTVTLTFRFGGARNDPTIEDMRYALNEIYAETELAIPQSDLAEHPNTWLTAVSEDGERCPTTTLDVYRGGLLRLTRLRDQDDSEPELEVSRYAVAFEDVLELWQHLKIGDESAVVRAF